MSGIDNASGAIKTSFYEATKTKSFYDPATFALTDFYEAPTNAEDGTPCLYTQYTYVPSTTRIDKTKESMSVWDASWDI